MCGAAPSRYRTSSGEVYPHVCGAASNIESMFSSSPRVRGSLKVYPRVCAGVYPHVCGAASRREGTEPIPAGADIQSPH